MPGQQAPSVREAATLQRQLDAENLAEALKRRRDECLEFVSAPDQSTADVISSPAVAAPAMNVTPRGDSGEDLAETWRRRREGVVEFESVPGHSTADASSVRDHSWPSEHIAADNPMPCDSADAYGGGVWVSARAPAEEATWSVPRGGKRTDDDLRDWMEKVRNKCEILESVQQESVADVQASAAGERCVDGDVAMGTVKKNVSELGKWMDSVQSRAASSDNPNSYQDVMKFNFTPAVRSTEFSLQPNSAQELRESTSDGSVGSVSARDALWSQALREELEDGGGPKPPPALTRLLLGGKGIEPAQRQSSRVFDMTVFDSSDEGSVSPTRKNPPAEYLDAAVGNHRLVKAFASKFLPWLRTESESDEAAPTPVFRIIAQLLRYHCPAAACAVEASSSQVDPFGEIEKSPYGRELATALSVAVNGGDSETTNLAPAALCEALFGGNDRGALLNFCDALVVTAEPALLLFTIVLLFAELAPEPEESLERLGRRLRGKDGLGGISANGVACVPRCIAGARTLLEATPLSVLEPVIRSTSAAGLGNNRIMPSMCMVSPAEVLHHTFETPSRLWRLVVVDVRMRRSELSLPVSVRLETASHGRRKQILSEIPYEEQIHLCLMGDCKPAPGEDAYQLCRYLFGPKIKRRHVSVVDGGWPAVEELAKSMQLDLFPQEPDSEPLLRAEVRRKSSTGSAEVSSTAVGDAAVKVGEAAGIAFKTMRQAASNAVAVSTSDAVVERVANAKETVAGTMANATETASTVSKKVTKNVGKAWKILGGLMASTANENGAEKATVYTENASNQMEPSVQESADAPGKNNSAKKQTPDPSVL